MQDSLMSYDTDTQSWSLIQRLKIPDVTCMQQLDDRLYLGTMKGLYLWHQNKILPILPDVEIFRLFASSKGELWIASRMEGLFRIDTEGKLRREEISKSKVASGQIREFVEDNRHYIWFGTFDGLQVYNPFDDTYKVYRPGIYPGQLEHESVFLFILTSREPSGWVPIMAVSIISIWNLTCSPIIILITYRMASV